MKIVVSIAPTPHRCKSLTLAFISKLRKLPHPSVVPLWQIENWKKYEFEDVENGNIFKKVLVGASLNLRTANSYFNDASSLQNAPTFGGILEVGGVDISIISGWKPVIFHFHLGSFAGALCLTHTIPSQLSKGMAIWRVMCAESMRPLTSRCVPWAKVFWGDGWVGKDARLWVCFKMKMGFENELRKYHIFGVWLWIIV